MSALASLQQRVVVPNTRSTRRVMCAPLRANNDLGDKARNVGQQIKSNFQSNVNEAGDRAQNAASDASRQVIQPASAGDDWTKSTQSAIKNVESATGQKFYAPTPELEKPSFNATRPNQYPVGFGAISELANSRLAMLGFTAAITAEVATGRSVWEQVTYSPVATFAIAATFVAFIIATYIPATKGAKLSQEQNGIFTPIAEVTNGRWAMVGWVALLVTEAIKGGALINA